MAWYGRRRSGEPRVGARAVVVGLGIAMIAVLALAVVGVTYLVVIGGRKVEFGQMTWIGATLPLNSTR